MSVGTVTLTLEVTQKQTGVVDVPDYLEVTGAKVLTTTLSDEHVSQLIADNVNDGVIGFENAVVDEALEDYRDNEPEDPRLAVLESLLRMNLAPQMQPGSFHDDAVAWLRKIDAAGE